MGKRDKVIISFRGIAQKKIYARKRVAATQYSFFNREYATLHLGESVGPSIRIIFKIASGFCITAPAVHDCRVSGPVSFTISGQINIWFVYLID